jgi:Zn-dependent membrane protease YugP
MHVASSSSGGSQLRHQMKEGDELGLILVLIGIVLLVLGYFLIGIICVVVDIVLLFVPAVPYGYSSWHRRGPP